jgi:hypothetical protein
MNGLILLLCLVLTGSQIFAQFSLSGEIRPRSEYRHGFQSLIAAEEEAAFFISQRSRLNFGFTDTLIKVFVSLQDIRVWGEVPQLNRSDVNSSVHEAWAEIPLITNYLHIKLGRQEVIYDNSRIFGNVDWAQQARSHDMALLKWKPAPLVDLHAGFAYNQESERRIGTFYGLTNYKTMQYGRVNLKPGVLNISLLFLNLGFQYAEDQTVFNQTFGGYFSMPVSPVTINGSAYIQSGRDNMNRDLSAYYLGAEATAPLNTQWKITAGFEWLSGTNQQDLINPQFAQNKSFNPYFGTNHRFNGHMDYFYVGNHLNNVGLKNPYLVLDYTRNRFILMAALHGFWADADILKADNPSQNMNSYLGAETDVILGWNLSRVASFRLGYSHMFATESMERIKGGDKNQPQYWLWSMVIIKPKFI